MEEKKSRGSFTGSIGFVLAAAGSAVGLGNIWRFPYLAAKDGGGLFLLVYIVLALTFGYTLLTTETAIGRKTNQSALTAYSHLHPKWGFLGTLACIVPAIILPYYCTIGGWVLKYVVTYAGNEGAAAAQDTYFGDYIQSQWWPIIFAAIFIIGTATVVYLGVDSGIEKLSKILMPILLVLILVICIFSLTLTYTDAEGVTRTGLEGFKVYLIPNLEGMTLSKFLGVVVDAMGQLFYSLSVCMGIMITYGSYVKKDTNMNSTIAQIEVFDTVVAFLAGLMIIPAVYTFMGMAGMESSGPSLMFETLPKIFEAMGGAGRWIALAFFLMVTFAAITSSVSVLEAIVSGFMDKFKMSRRKACVIIAFLALIVAIIVCLGYNVLYFKIILPNGAGAQILDILDYISNSIIMPVVGILTCILVGWVLKPETVIEEFESSGHKFSRRGLYVVMVKYVAPIMLFVLLLQAAGVFKMIENLFK